MIHRARTIFSRHSPPLYYCFPQSLPLQITTTPWITANMLKMPSYPDPNLNRLAALTVHFLLGGIRSCRGMFAAAGVKHHPRRLSQRNTNSPEGLYPYITMRICVARPFIYADTTFFQTYANWSPQQVSLA